MNTGGTVFFLVQCLFVFDASCSSVVYQLNKINLLYVRTISEYEMRIRNVDKKWNVICCMW